MKLTKNNEKLTISFIVKGCADDCGECASCIWADDHNLVLLRDKKKKCMLSLETQGYEQQEAEYEEYQLAYEREQNDIWMLEQAFLAGLKPEDFAASFEVDVLPF